MEAKIITSIVDGYVSAFNEIVSKVKDESVAIAILAEMGKDRRCKEVRQAKEEKRQIDNCASAKQLSYLASLGVNVSSGISKREASDLIEQAKAR